MFKKIRFIDEFILKIIAYVFMTIDHLGVFLNMYGLASEFANVCRILGRITFPLIVFMIIEAVIHTKNFWMYFLRLSMVAVSIMLFQIIAGYFVDGTIQNIHSPFIDLLLCALIVYFLRKKNWMIVLAILPIAYSFIGYIVPLAPILFGFKITWFPFFLMPDYSLIGTFLVLLMYIGHIVSVRLVKKFFCPDSIEEKEVIETNQYRESMNYLSSVAIILVSFLIFALGTDALSAKVLVSHILSVQTYMVLAIIPLLLYNGKRGYNAKWFQYGCYLYFPLHIILLFVIFYLSLH